VVEYLHLCPRGPRLESASLHNKKQGKGCLEIPFHSAWELSGLGMPRDITDLRLKEKLKKYKSFQDYKQGQLCTILRYHSYTHKHTKNNP
jgi:hypothetical protein